MKNKKNMIKNILCFVLGGIVFGTIGVYAATTLLSQSVYYNNSTSGASSTNVQGALDELYTRAKTWINPSNNYGTPQYYAFGTYKGWCSSTDTSCNSYSDFPTTSTSAPSGKRVYFAKYPDGGYGVCFNNGTQHCFRGRNWGYEKEHAKKVFSSCYIPTSSSYGYARCQISGFLCYFDYRGYVYCRDANTTENCTLDVNGSLDCILDP